LNLGSWHFEYIVDPELRQLVVVVAGRSRKPSIEASS
jgi:hypothetical protein